MLRFLISGAVCAVLLSTPVLGQSPAPGYVDDDVSVAGAGVFVGGFDVLPNGHYALYDGVDVLELDPTDGSTLGVIYTPVGAPFGSFLELSPDESTLYFGESSNGDIIAIDLSSGAATTVGNRTFVYDMAFDAQGRAFVSWSPGFSQGSFVSWFDLANGTFDDVVQSVEATGPLLFDLDGNLVYGFPSSINFPPPPDLSRVVTFTESQVNGALGPSVLLESDGALLALVDGTSDFAMDASGDLFVTDNAYYSLTEIDRETLAERTVWDGPDFQALTYARFVPALDADARFEGYQPGDSGRLICIATDFFTFNDALTIHPDRPEIRFLPGDDVAPGNFEFQLSGGPPNGYGLAFVTGGLSGSEFAGSNGSWPAPLWWGLDFTGGILLLQGFPLDGTGALSLPGVNPGLGGLGLGVQVVVGDSTVGPFYGTSQPLRVIFQ